MAKLRIPCSKIAKQIWNKSTKLSSVTRGSGPREVSKNLRYALTRELQIGAGWRPVSQLTVLTLARECRCHELQPKGSL